MMGTLAHLQETTYNVNCSDRVVDGPAARHEHIRTRWGGGRGIRRSVCVCARRGATVTPLRNQDYRWKVRGGLCESAGIVLHAQQTVVEPHVPRPGRRC